MITCESPAKLTLSLRITGVRNDGFHLIDAEMVALSLADTISISPSDEIHITTSGPYATGITTDSTNLVHRALVAVNRTASVHIEKNIPHGGGLGGGSSNAATIFRWASNNDMQRASAIGADVPFSIVGGRARVTGIGDHVEPLPYEHKDITLFIPPVHTPTPLVYRTWDEMGGPSGARGNDLEPAALHSVPELALWREKIVQLTDCEPLLAGSGSTWFLPGHLTIDASVPPGLKVVHATTRPDSGRVVEQREGEM